MLRALKSQLNQLAVDSKDNFSEKIRLSSGGACNSADSRELKDFVLLLPDMIAQIRLWAEDVKVPPEIKRLNGFVLTYLYHPLDLLPDQSYGLYGYLDDAYLVGDVYHRTMMFAKSEIDSGYVDVGFSPKMGGWLQLARKAIPREAQMIDRLLEELVKGNDTAFQDLVAQTENDGLIKT